MNNYRLRMQTDIPYKVVGSSKLVQPEVVRKRLLDLGYCFKRPGVPDVPGIILENEVPGVVPENEVPGVVLENEVYQDPQQMLADIERGKLEAVAGGGLEVDVEEDVGVGSQLDVEGEDVGDNNKDLE